MHELVIGDCAPDLQLMGFLRGDAFNAFAPGVVHVIEFWATWCGPCRRSIPHLSELQLRYPDVVVLGVAVAWKNYQELQAFVEEQGEAIAYRIAADLPAQEGQRNPTRAAWCDAGYQVGVPSAFIVDGSARVVWMGHPLELEQPLAAVIDGSFDLPGQIVSHQDWLRNEKIREGRALDLALAALGVAENPLGMLALYAETFAEHPELEYERALRRVELLIKYQPQALLAYVHRLADELYAADPGRLLSLGVVLTESEQDAELARLAGRVLAAAERLLGEHAVGRSGLKLRSAQAKAALASGDVVDALRFARDAQVLAEQQALDQASQQAVAGLLQRCTAAQLA
jgi:thiol-disulfide isomerase/thioredoxin